MATVIAGMVLPPELDPVVTSARWTGYTEDVRLDPLRLEEVFGEPPDSTWRFYTVEEIESMTSDWQQEDDPGWFGSAPNDIHPQSSLLIGELGYDRPIALDYRSAVPVVRVMRLDGRWRVVASSAGELLARLGILSPDDSDFPA